MITIITGLNIHLYFITACLQKGFLKAVFLLYSDNVFKPTLHLYLNIIINWEATNNSSPNPNTQWNKKKIQKILMWLCVQTLPQRLRNHYGWRMGNKEELYRMRSERQREVGDLELYIESKSFGFNGSHWKAFNRGIIWLNLY